MRFVKLYNIQREAVKYCILFNVEYFFLYFIMYLTTTMIGCLQRFACQHLIVFFVPVAKVPF